MWPQEKFVDCDPSAYNNGAKPFREPRSSTSTSGQFAEQDFHEYEATLVIGPLQVLIMPKHGDALWSERPMPNTPDVAMKWPRTEPASGSAMCT